MDTSETYIKMCDCPEIQEHAKYEAGDYLSSGDGIEIIGSLMKVGDNTATRGGYDYDFFSYVWHRAIWLPRQDQLQEMVDEVANKKHFVFRFNDFLHNNYQPITHMNAFVWLANLPDDVISMERMWLAFVMKEKYNKTWNGEVWI